MGINPTDGEGIESFFGSDWCDFRFRLDGCKHAGVWRTLYIIAIVFTAPLVLIGIYLIHRKIYVKLWRAGGGILQIVDGAVKPRANEAFLLTGTLSLAGRLLYWCVTVGGGFGSNIVQEFFHDWPFVILWHGGVLFTVGVIYATPKSHITVNKKKGREGARQEATQITRSKLPSPQLCNVLLGLFLIVPSVTLPLFALLDGAARDRGNYALAKKYNTIHYLLWGIYCLLLSGVAVYFGYKLWKILDSNVENVHRGGSGKTTESGGPGKSDTDVPPEFRRAIIMVRLM
ncbi:hypothetical protein DFS34DRAFT_455055 [Phlyctochytrium arcticum]|nr:hypothetical protein DFS34DRAFT_455055 [Phlyctochytrium arcticum]